MTNPPRDYLEVRLFKLTYKLDRVQHLTEGGVFNTVVGDFKSLIDVTVWVQDNLPSDTPKSEHAIDLNILLEGILQT